MKLINCLLSALIPVLSFAQEIPSLTLSASATISKPADELQLKIGVITIGDTAEQALEENSQQMNQVIINLQMLGLDAEDYETSQFSIQPTYTPYPQNPPPNWHAKINGYEISNSILIHTAKLDLAGKIIDAANRAGANSISNIRFGIHNPRTYWSEALSAAGANAIHDAQAIAQSTGVELVRIRSISLNETHMKSPQFNVACYCKSGGMEAAPPIEPGDVSIEATVTLIYEIK